MKRNVQVLTIPWAKNWGAYPHDGSESTFSLTHAHHIHRNFKTAHLPAEILITSKDNGTFPSELFLS